MFRLLLLATVFLGCDSGSSSEEPNDSGPDTTLVDASQLPDGWFSFDDGVDGLPDPTDDGVPPLTDASPTDAADGLAPPPPQPTLSAGCGQDAIHETYGVDINLELGPEGRGLRWFHLKLPDDYNPNQPHPLVVGYPGTDWIGQQARGYLRLESGGPQEIFVYLDPLVQPSGKLGWALFNQNNPDLLFTAAVLDYIEAHYCVDTERVFSTGQSWGGDMSHLVSCVLGDRFRASVPVAAIGGPRGLCIGNTAVWSYFGQADDHFNNTTHGENARDFWLNERGCDGIDAFHYLDLGDGQECQVFHGCSSPVRYCFYGAEFLHQIPDYYSEATMDYFRSF